MVRVSGLILGFCAALTLLRPAPAPAADKIPVDVELLLGVDISGSVDSDEARMQREGYARGLNDPMVVKAITGGFHGRIAVALFEWSDSYLQNWVLDWTVIQDQKSADAVSKALLEAPIRTARRTSIAGALLYGMTRFGTSNFEGQRRVMDISGDGPNNDGGPVDLARDKVLAAGISVNGLAIINDKQNTWGFPTLQDLDRYYEGCVTGGPGSFVVVAEGFKSFGEAVRRKLILEVAARPVPPADWASYGPKIRGLEIEKVQNRTRNAPAGNGFLPTAAPYPKGCDIGERQSQEYFRRRFD